MVFMPPSKSDMKKKLLTTEEVEEVEAAEVVVTKNKEVNAKHLKEGNRGSKRL